jgi:hypothetical protein
LTVGVSIENDRLRRLIIPTRSEVMWRELEEKTEVNQQKVVERIRIVSTDPRREASVEEGRTQGS